MIIVLTADLDVTEPCVFLWNEKNIQITFVVNKKVVIVYKKRKLLICTLEPVTFRSQNIFNNILL